MSLLCLTRYDGQQDGVLCSFSFFLFAASSLRSRHSKSRICWKMLLCFLSVHFFICVVEVENKTSQGVLKSLLMLCWGLVISSQDIQANQFILSKFFLFASFKVVSNFLHFTFSCENVSDKSSDIIFIQCIHFVFCKSDGAGEAYK